MKVSIEGSVVEVESGASCRDVLKSALSGKKFKSVLAVKCGDAMLDLTATVPTACETLEPVYADSREGLELVRHSAAHVMADAV